MKRNEKVFRDNTLICGMFWKGLESVDKVFGARDRTRTDTSRNAST